jgi:hypothetical protein
MADAHGGHPVLNMVLIIVAVGTGVSGSAHNITKEDLEFYDMLLAVVLKAVSILSFTVILLLNFQKLIKMFFTWFKPKKDE